MKDLLHKELPNELQHETPCQGTEQNTWQDTIACCGALKRQEPLVHQN